MVFLQTLALGIVFFTFCLSGSAYADTVSPYETQINRFTSKPTICTVEPNSAHLSSSQARLILEESKRGVYEWIQLLQERTSNKDKWAINYLEVPNKDKNSFDFSSCSVIINFESETGKKASHNLGTHYYVAGTSHITVFYKVNECKQSLLDSCKNFDRNLIKIGSTIKHEFGHALGLGHYKSDKIKNKVWYDDPQTAPSIMLEYSKGTEVERVTAKDITQVIEIYRDAGFIDQHLPKIRKTLPIALTQLTPSELTISDSNIKASKMIHPVVISGKFDKVLGNLGAAELLILRPDLKLEKIKVLIETDGSFEHEYEVHSKLPTGVYFVQAKYGKNVTEKNTFEVH